MAQRNSPRQYAHPAVASGSQASKTFHRPEKLPPSLAGGSYTSAPRVSAPQVTIAGQVPRVPPVSHQVSPSTSHQVSPRMRSIKPQSWTSPASQMSPTTSCGRAGTASAPNLAAAAPPSPHVPFLVQPVGAAARMTSARMPASRSYEPAPPSFEGRARSVDRGGQSSNQASVASQKEMSPPLDMFPLDAVGGDPNALITKADFINMFTAKMNATSPRSPPRSPVSRFTSAPVPSRSPIRSQSSPQEMRGRSLSVKVMPGGQHVAPSRQMSPVTTSPQQLPSVTVRTLSPPPEIRGRSASMKVMPSGQRVASPQRTSPVPTSPQQLASSVMTLPRSPVRSLSPTAPQSAAKATGSTWSAPLHVQGLAATATQYLQGPVPSQAGGFAQQIPPAAGTNADILTVTSIPKSPKSPRSQSDRDEPGAALPRICFDKLFMNATSDSAEHHLFSQIQELRKEFKDSIKAEIEQVRTEIYGLLVNMAERQNASLQDKVSHAIQQELPSLYERSLSMNYSASHQPSEHSVKEGTIPEFSRAAEQQIGELPGIVYDVQQSAKGLDCMLREVLNITLCLARDLADERQRRREEVASITRRLGNLEKNTGSTTGGASADWSVGSSYRSSSLPGGLSLAMQSSLQLPSESPSLAAVHEPINVPSSRSVSGQLLELGGASAPSSSLVNEFVGTADFATHVGNDGDQGMPLDAQSFSDKLREIADLNKRIIDSDQSFENVDGLIRETAMLSEMLEQRSPRPVP